MDVGNSLRNISPLSRSASLVASSTEGIILFSFLRLSARCHPFQALYPQGSCRGRSSRRCAPGTFVVSTTPICYRSDTGEPLLSSGGMHHYLLLRDGSG